VIDAALGRKEDAIREGRRAVELLPLERDAFNGMVVREFLAVIYAWTGEKDSACQQLASTLQLPASVSCSPGQRHAGREQLDPDWFELFDRTEHLHSRSVQADGKILAGGDFNNIGGQPRLDIARLDAITGLADSWNPSPNSPEQPAGAH
jgi:hypothetical protein